MATYLRMGFVCAFALCVAGCGVFRSKADIALQKTPGYQNGYQDGCASANAENASMRGSEKSSVYRPRPATARLAPARENVRPT